MKRIAIVGSGFMGSQIGLQCAIKKYSVSMVDISNEALEKVRANHERELDSKIEKHSISFKDKRAILNRISYTTIMREGVSDVDLVIEAVPENLKLKREVFNDIDRLSPPHTIIATNSSSIRISLIEDATSRPSKVLNLHFYPPISQRNVVELMGGTSTSDETMYKARKFALGIGLTPLMVRKESTGFLFNRVWRAIKKECLHLVDEGVASFEDVDRAWMIVFNNPMGPFGFMDVIGLDVVRDIELVYYNESGDESDYPPKILLDKVKKGQLGIKTGKGFYSYPNPAFREPDWLKGEL